MAKQSLPPSRITEDNKQDFDSALVIGVKDSLNDLLNSPHVIVNVESGKNSKPSIYKVPHFMRENNPKAFEPELVSFGPYHHGKTYLLPMELEKSKAFHHFITNYELNVESIVRRVSRILEHLKGSYDELKEEWTQNPGNFLRLMIIDGCFMLEFFKECPTSLRKKRGYIERDIVLLENQLPMKLLDELYSIANRNQTPAQCTQTLKSLICKSLHISKDGLRSDYFHILDMFKATMLQHPENKEDQIKIVNDPDGLVTPPATQLREAGIKFQVSDKGGLMDVSFDSKRGVLRLPHLALGAGTDSIFSNVMAFEKLHVDAGMKVTSFIVLMNNLINEDKDVTLLASEKILHNRLGNEHDVADLFNKMAQWAPLELDTDVIAVHEKVNEHCIQAWNKWRASLKHNYFQNPWTIISVIAAILGFALLILQVIYQLSDYYIKD